MHDVGENLHDAGFVDRHAQPQASLVEQGSRKPVRHRLDRRRLQEHEAVGILLGQALIGSARVQTGSRRSARRCRG